MLITQYDVDYSINPISLKAKLAVFAVFIEYSICHQEARRLTSGITGRANGADGTIGSGLRVLRCMPLLDGLGLYQILTQSFQHSFVSIWCDCPCPFGDAA
jgi:hypothetical protein